MRERMITVKSHLIIASYDHTDRIDRSNERLLISYDKISNCSFNLFMTPLSDKMCDNHVDQVTVKVDLDPQGSFS